MPENMFKSRERAGICNPIRKPVERLRHDAEKRNESVAGGGAWRALDFLLYLLMVVLIMFSVRAVILDPVRVEGHSMESTLLDREVMLVNRTAYAFSAPKRGDIVICYYPDEYYTGTNKTYATRVKRVIAVGGDTLSIRGGCVYVNGEKLEEPYLNGLPTSEKDVALLIETGALLPADAGQTENADTADCIVPEGTVFVMGDNRPSSNDSRVAAVGPIPLERVIGRAFTVIYPFNKLRLI